MSTAVQYKFSPEPLVQRLESKREGSKLWDEISMRVTNLIVLIAVPAIAWLDVVRFHWSELDANFVVIGLVLIIVSTVLLNWAMIANPYFEPTVRIQEDRGHKVISGGPYRIVGHLGYLAGIMYTLSIPPIIGSLSTFIPVGICVSLVTTRTLPEDRTLYEELDGYSEYAGDVKYELLPWLW